jgi:hypothetical protein
MDSGLSDKSAKLPVFDGKKEKFQLWWRRFKAYAAVHKFSEALRDGGDPDLPETDSQVIDSSSEEGKRMLLATRRNTLAVAAFTMAFETEDLMKHVIRGSTNDWQDGNAKLIVDSLLKKFKPTDIMSKAEMKAEIRKVSMKVNDDPATLFTQLTAIEQQFKVDMDLEDKLAVILEVCPQEYKAVLTAEQRQKGNQLTENDLEDAMSQHFRSLNVGKNIQSANKDGDDDNEIGLGAVDIVCHYCKKKGHKKADCYKLKNKNKNNNNTSGKRFQGNCNHCGKRGHKEADCWRKPGNQDKRPAWHKKFSE